MRLIHSSDLQIGMVFNYFDSDAATRLQDARQGLGELSGPFDMAFLDGVKMQYGDYFDAVLPLLGSGSVLVVDNVLRSGRVAVGRGDESVSDEQIAYARQFNQRLLTHPELVGTITPVGDGLLLAVKR